MSSDNDSLASSSDSGVTRRRMISALTAAATAGFAGCAGGGGNGGGSGNSTSGTGTGAVKDQATNGPVDWWHINIRPEEQNFIKNEISQFENNHSYKVDQTVYENSQYKPAITNALGTDNAPDMFYIWPGPTRLGRYVTNGQVLKLNDYLSQDLLDKYVDTAITQCQYEGRNILGWAQPSGNLYSIPTDFAGILLWHNKSVLKEAGLDPANFKHRTDLSWEQFLNTCDKIKSATGKAPIVVGNRNRWTIGHWVSAFLMKAVGTQTFLATTYDRNNMDWTAQPYVKALQRLQTLQQKGYMQRGVNSLNNNEAASMFFRDEAAFYHQGTWMPSVAAEQAPDDFAGIPEEVDYMWWPFFEDLYADGKNERMGLSNATTAVSTQAKQRGEANLNHTMEWFKRWNTNPEILKMQIRKLGSIPPRPDVWESMDLSPTEQTLRAALADLREADRACPVFDVAYLPQATEAMLSGGQELFTGTPPKKILRDVQQAQSQAIQQYQ